MKIKLIAPARKPEWGESFWDLKTLCKLTGKKAGGAPLALPTLAALTPSDVEVVLTDENVEPIDFEEKVDLIGITGMTCVIPRSYEIADEYRKRGVKVVMGGIHVSMLPEEAIQHCDAVAIGEAEGFWEKIVRDAQKNQLQKLYRGDSFPDLTNSPIPRWDLLKNDKYTFFVMQTGRGCPYDCDFCSVKIFNGRQYRHKKIENVINEVKLLKTIDNRKWIFFNDDNILAIPEYAKNLFKALSAFKNNVYWCQGSLNRLDDDEILELMNKSGCKVIFIGFESISKQTIQSYNKTVVNNIDKYNKVIDKVHSHGISVFGSFITGSDSDDKNVFDDTVNFIMNTNIAFSMINILVALPGTKLRSSLEDANRILTNDWQKYNAEFVTFKPKSLSTEELHEGREKILRDIYSYKNLYKRLKSLWSRNVFVRDKSNCSNLFTKGRILLSLKGFLSKDINKIFFILKSLWNKNVTSVSTILIALSYHDYSLREKNRKIIKNLSKII